MEFQQIEKSIEKHKNKSATNRNEVTGRKKTKLVDGSTKIENLLRRQIEEFFKQKLSAWAFFWLNVEARTGLLR